MFVPKERLPCTIRVPETERVTLGDRVREPAMFRVGSVRAMRKGKPLKYKQMNHKKV